MAMACRPATPAPMMKTLRRRDRPRRRREHREELAPRLGAADHGHVTRHGAERRQAVHALGQRRARHQLHRERRHAALGQPLQHIGVLVRPHLGQEQGPGRNQLYLVGPIFPLQRTVDLRDHVGPFEQGLRILNDLGAGIAVLVVCEGGSEPGPALHDELDLVRSKTLDRLRGHGHALIERRMLLRDSYSHGLFALM